MVRKRLYPKCFKAHFDAVFFYEFMTENYQECQSKKCFTDLCKMYTSLLCGLHLLQSRGEPDLVRRRFQRFLSLHYYQQCEWKLLIQMYRSRLHHLTQELLTLVSMNDGEIITRHLDGLNLMIFSCLESLETKEKMKMV